MSRLLTDLLEERDYLLADGATGTNMMAMGLPAGRPPDLWNTEKPENVTRLHESFLEVGSDIILTNTFGSNACRLRLDMQRPGRPRAPGQLCQLVRRRRFLRLGRDAAAHGGGVGKGRPWV